MTYNLVSPTVIQSRVDLDDLASWFANEIVDIPKKERDVIELIATNIDYFARWAAEALVFFPGSVRANNSTYHKYTVDLKKVYRDRTQLTLDTRPNGPAIAAFVFAGGKRPARAGSTNAWSIHHIYNGKFPYIGRSSTLHAVKHGEHFTNSAGLVAAHPILDTMVDEYPGFAWLLRAMAFKRFAYDPDNVFVRLPAANDDALESEVH